jgi:phage-related protein
MSEATLGRANVIIGAALDQLDKDLAGARGRVENALAGIAKITAGIVVAGFAALAGGLAACVGEAMEAQGVMLLLDNTLENLGLAGTGVRDQIIGVADGLQKFTRFSDDAAIAAQNAFLQMGIGEERLPRVTWAAANLATAMGTDLVSASETLGRALAKPETAAARLLRANVVLTDAQQAQIKAFTDVGDAAGAQGVILDALDGKYGGLAAAAGETFAGQLDRVKNSLLNVLETVGMQVLPILQALADKLLTWLADPAVQAGIDNFVAGLAVWVDYIAANVLPVIFEVGQAIINGIGAAITWLGENQAVVVGILGIIAAGFVVWGHAAAVAAIETLTALAPVILTIAAIGAVVALFYLAWTQNWGGIQEKVAAVWAAIKPIIDAIGALIQSVWQDTIKPALVAFAAKIAEWWEKIAPQVQAVWDAIWTKISTVATAIATFIQTNMDTIKGIFEAVWGAIQSVLEVAWSIISGIVETALLIFQGKWGEAWERIKTMFSEVWEGIKSFFSAWWDVLTGVFELAWAAFGGVITTAWGAVKGWFETAWQDVIAWFEGLPATLEVIGKSLIEGVLNGMKNAWSAIVDWLAGAFEQLYADILAFFGIGSPSKLMADVGLNIGLGLVGGMQRSLAGVEQAAAALTRALAGQGPGPGAPGVSASGPVALTGNDYPQQSGAQWTVNIYPQQSTGRVLEDLLVAQSILGV